MLHRVGVQVPIPAPSFETKKDAPNFLDIKTGIFEFFSSKIPVFALKKLEIFLTNP